AGLIIAALNPAQRLQEVNEVKSATNANDIEKAIRTYIIENNGNLPSAFDSLEGGYYDICNPNGNLANCINLSDLGANLGNIPQDSIYGNTNITGHKIKYIDSTNQILVYSHTEYLADTAVLPVKSGLRLWLDAD